MDLRYTIRTNYIKAGFQHELAYRDFKGLPRKITSNKALHYKTFNINKNPKYDGYQHELAWIAYKFFNQKTSIQTEEQELIVVWFLNTNN